MKIILLKDVPGTGRAHEIKEVAPGFCGNFLIPNKLAVVATPTALKSLEERKKRTEAESKITEDLMMKNLASLKEATVVISGKANEEGHLFAGIHAREILEALKKQLRIELPEETLKLDSPIKSVGKTEVVAEIHGKKVSFTLSVEKA